MTPAVFGLATCLAVGLAGACLADDLKAEQRFTETIVSFDLKGSHSNVTLSISGPNSFHASASSPSGAPTIDLRRFGALADGLYTYQLTAATNEKVKIATKLDNGRDARATVEPLSGVDTSGTFVVRGGVIVKRDANVPPGRRDQDQR